MKQCKRCNKQRPDSEFISSDVRFAAKELTRCSKCRKDRNRQAKNFYHRWHDEQNLAGRKYYHEHRERYRLIRRRAALKRKYGLTIEQYEELINGQGNKCAICDNVFKNVYRVGGGKNEPCVDHDHKTGRVRGILCRGCNLGLSIIEDEEFVRKANQYLGKLEK